MKEFYTTKVPKPKKPITLVRSSLKKYKMNGNGIMKKSN